MKRFMAVLLQLLATAAISQSARSAEEIAAPLTLGDYIAVTESEWTIELNLDGDGSATYTISNWEAGKAASTKKSEVVKGRWEVEADVVTVSFSGGNAGKAVVYKTTSCLSYRSFGAEDCSIGLEPVSNTMPHSFSQPLWSVIEFKVQGRR